MSNHDKELTILVPVYNEEKRLPSCLDGLLSYMEGTKIDYEILVSADGCTDRTVEIAEEYSRKYEGRIRVVSFPERLGKGGGVWHGVRYARGRIVVLMDVDLASPPSEIPKLLEEIRKGADIVIGSRNLPDSKILVQPPFYRKVLGKAFNLLFRVLFGIKLYDTQCGFKAFRRSVFNDLNEQLNVEGFAFDVDLLVKAHRRGYRIVEVPVKWRYVKGSKVNVLKQIFRMGSELLMVWLELKKSEPERRVKKVEKFYDEVRGDAYYNALRSKFLPRRWWHLHKNRAISSRVMGKNVLDVGCGSGVMVEFLPHKDVVGADVGEKFIRFAQRKYGCRASFVKCDARKLPFREGVFDTVIMSEVLEHLKEPQKAIMEAYRVLKGGGVYIATTPRTSLRWSLIEAVWTKLRRENLEIEHTAFTYHKIRYFLRKVGFSQEIEIYPFMLGCLLFIYAKKPIES